MSLEDQIEQEQPQEEQPQSLDEPTQEAPSQESDIPDIGSFEKFRFEGREMTPQDLRNSYLMQSDYTRKTQELAEERKYYDNLQYDLDRVKGDPNLVAEFKKIYPEKFHAYLGYVHTEQPAQQTQQTPQIPKEYEDRLAKIEQSYQEKEIQAIERDLDATFKDLKDKYPFADEAVAISRAQQLLETNQQVDKASWEQIFKQEHDRMSKRFDEIQKEKVAKQQAAHREGADTPQGGGAPGRAPRKFKNISEATEAFLESEGL